MCRNFPVARVSAFGFSTVFVGCLVLYGNSLYLQNYISQTQKIPPAELQPILLKKVKSEKKIYRFAAAIRRSEESYRLIKTKPYLKVKRVFAAVDA